MINCSALSGTGRSCDKGVRCQLIGIESNIGALLHMIDLAQTDSIHILLREKCHFTAKLCAGLNRNAGNGFLGQRHLVRQLLAADQHGCPDGIITLFPNGRLEYRVPAAHQVFLNTGNSLLIFPSVDSRCFHRRVFSTGHGAESTCRRNRRAIVRGCKICACIKHPKVFTAAHPLDLLIQPIQQCLDGAILIGKLKRFAICRRECLRHRILLRQRFRSTISSSICF